jgi:RNA polymerase II subunit A small phosphatase-like protein
MIESRIPGAEFGWRGQGVAIQPSPEGIMKRNEQTARTERAKVERDPGVVLHADETMDAIGRLLVILDLDETLIHSSGRPLDRQHDFVVDCYLVHTRPGLNEFLAGLAAFCDIAIWSSAGADYVDVIVNRIMPAPLLPAFVWSRDRCGRQVDWERQEEYFVKDLKKVKRRGYRMERIVIVEDEPQKVERNYGNALYVTPWYGTSGDDELPKLHAYLESLQTVPDVRCLEKRGWRSDLPPKREPK